MTIRNELDQLNGIITVLDDEIGAMEETLDAILLNVPATPQVGETGANVADPPRTELENSVIHLQGRLNVMIAKMKETRERVNI